MKRQQQTDHHLPKSDDYYKGLFEYMREGFAYCRMTYEAGEPRDFVYLEVNPAFEKMTGLSGIRGRLGSEVVPGAHQSNPELFEIYGRVARTGNPEKFETYVDGLQIWLAVSIHSPKPEHFVAIFDNVTERKQAERQWSDQRAHSNDLIHAVTQIMTHLEKALTLDDIIQTLGRELNGIDLICIMAAYDKEFSTFTINYTSLESKTSEPLENSIGIPPVKHSFPLRDLVLILDEEDIRRPSLIMNTEQELQVLFPRGREEDVSEIVAGIGAGSEGLRLPLMFEENLLGILWVWGKSITKADLPILSILTKQVAGSMERARLYQEVQNLALTDPLTGLHNRRSLLELGKIEFARAKRAGSSFSCLLLDVDYFEQINDTYGHLIGDQVMWEFADRCKRSVREADLIGRYGGPEIVILLLDTDLDAAVLVAERLRGNMQNAPIKVSGLELNITVSVGAATKDENTANLPTLLARADQARYVAKYKGRNRVAVSR